MKGTTVHDILGERFANRVLPWQRANQVPGHPRTAVEALQTSGLDYIVEKQPLTVTAFGKELIVPNRYALVRGATSFDPNPATLGMVGKDYAPLQNMDIAEAIDRAGLTTRWRFDTAGYVHGGQRVFITLDAGEEEIAHEKIHNFFFVATGHDGDTATTIAYSPVRLLCLNALLRGVRAASTAFVVTHEQHNHDELIYSLQTLRSVEDTHATMRQVLNNMASRSLSNDDVAGVLAATYPDPKKPRRLDVVRNLPTPADGKLLLAHQQAAWDKAEQTHRNACARNAELRRTARGLYSQLNDEGYPGNAGSAWNLYQAITELSNHREGHQRREGTDNIAVSVLFGSRAAEMGRAWIALGA